MTFQNAMIYLGASENKAGVRKQEFLNCKFANRHGLITGATGTGKTVTLQILAEGFSNEGVSVFAADVKGDLSGIAAKGVSQDFLAERAKEIGFDTYTYAACPTIFWDLYGEAGHPIRTTVTEMGPLLLARILNLNDTQEGVLNIVFKYADDNGLLILDLKDLQKVLELIGSDKELQTQLRASYGNVNAATVGAVQRQLLVLEQQGGANLFGEPALNVKDFLRTTTDGKGYVNILSAEKLMGSPRLYATFLLWMLSELFEELPEVGDPEKPKLVFFFDEAHLLFSEAPAALLEKIEQVVRLIRSKGVGVYFVTQNPADIPDKVAAQLGNRVQHALRAFTPRDQKAVKAAAETFRQNPEIDCEKIITELGKGEALVSMLEGNGTPSVVQVTKIRPPSSRLGPLTQPERQQIVDSSPVQGQYEEVADRESAYEVLQARSEGRVAGAQQQQEAANSGGFWGSILGGTTGPHGGHRQGVGEAVAKGVVRTISTTVGRSIGAAVLGAVIGKAAGSRRTGGGAIAGSIARNVGASVTRNVTGSIMRGVLGSLTR